VIGRIDEVNVHADVAEAKTTGNGTNHQETSTAKSVNEPENPQSAHNRFDLES
jgi:hypothetical protein